MRNEDLKDKKILYLYIPNIKDLGVTRIDADNSDMADQYLVVESNTIEGIMVYGLINDKWSANPKTRWLIKSLLQDVKKLHNQIKYLEDCYKTTKP